MSDDTLTPQNEIWKTISEPSLKGLYSVSSIGRVRRNAIPIINALGVEKVYRETILAAKKSRGGYLRVVLSAEPTRLTRSVHFLVAREFCGIPPCEYGVGKGKCQVDHIDGNKINNLPANLQWIDCAAHGKLSTARGQRPLGELNGARKHPETRPRGINNKNSKITDNDARLIRDASAKGVSYSNLSAAFGLNKSNVACIITRRTWKHVV